MALEPDSLMILKRNSPECHFHPIFRVPLYIMGGFELTFCASGGLYSGPRSRSTGLEWDGGDCAPWQKPTEGDTIEPSCHDSCGEPFLKFIVKFIDLGCDPDFSCRMSSRIRTRPGHLSLWRRRHTSGWEIFVLEKFAEFFPWILMNLDACSLSISPQSVRFESFMIPFPSIFPLLLFLGSLFLRSFVPNLWFKLHPFWVIDGCCPILFWTMG